MCLILGVVYCFMICVFFLTLFLSISKTQSVSRTVQLFEPTHVWIVRELLVAKADPNAISQRAHAAQIEVIEL